MPRIEINFSTPEHLDPFLAKSLICSFVRRKKSGPVSFRAFVLSCFRDSFYTVKTTGGSNPWPRVSFDDVFK
jgi:hypothetical protein